MNKLMRFNPDPFDSEMEQESTFGLPAEAEAFEGEEEYRGGGRGRARPSMQAYRAKTPFKQRNPYAKAAVRPNPKPPSSWPQGRASRRWSYPVGVGVPVWPYADGAAARDYAPTSDPAADAAATPSDHVRWIQTSLNSVLGLRLPVDGVMNAPTRSAVRSFQERRGLPINGLVGPETERALREAAPAFPSAAEPPPGPAPAGPEPSPAPAPPAAGGEEPQEFEWELDAYHHTPAHHRRTPATPSGSMPSVKTLREAIVRLAKNELGRWQNGRLKERDPKLRTILQDYWKTGPGLSFSATQIGSEAFQASHPWSAAFISWVMRKAGARKAFKYASAHAVYIVAAKANRTADNQNPFKAYRLNEVAPRVGDLICRSRAGSHATYDNIHAGMTTHCDIVVAVQPKALTVIGGNVANSVSSRTVRTDDLGRVVEPNVFAVIRLGSHKPRVPGGGSVTPVTPPGPTPTPAPAPTPSRSTAPKLIKQDTSPPSATLYAEIDLGIVDRFKLRAAPMTGIFLPDGFAPSAQVDVILYLHGHKAVRDLTIDGYWNGQRFAYGALREKLNAAGRNVVLIAPTLGARSEAGGLIEPGGLDAYLAKALAAIGAYGPGAGKGAAPSLGNLILACHSGGGLPMRKLAGGNDKAVANLRECWGFDCTYNGGDDTFWAGWARKNPKGKCYFNYIKGSQTARLSERLRDMQVANAIVQPSKDGRHNYVPITHLLERVQGAAFLGALGGRGGSAPVVPPPEPGPGPSEEPADLKSLSHAAFIAFVGKFARKAMAATGVPASVTVAQAIVETGWGKHTIGAAKNLFGIKGKGPAGTVRVPTREFVNGEWVTIDANFAKYDSFEQSITEHARFFLRNKRYAAALKVKDDADAFARAIHKAGYATGPDYAAQLIKLMKAHDLYRFDR